MGEMYQLITAGGTLYYCTYVGNFHIEEGHFIVFFFIISFFLIKFLMMFENIFHVFVF